MVANECSTFNASEEPTGRPTLELLQRLTAMPDHHMADYRLQQWSKTRMRGISLSMTIQYLSHTEIYFVN